jgi:hypothetical protein
LKKKATNALPFYEFSVHFHTFIESETIFCKKVCGAIVEFDKGRKRGKTGRHQEHTYWAFSLEF